MISYPPYTHAHGIHNGKEFIVAMVNGVTPGEVHKHEIDLYHERELSHFQLDWDSLVLTIEDEAPIELPKNAIVNVASPELDCSSFHHRPGVSFAQNPERFTATLEFLARTTYDEHIGLGGIIHKMKTNHYLRAYCKGPFSIVRDGKKASFNE